MSEKVTVTIGRNRYKTEITVNEHVITADEPKEQGGQNLGPSPTDLLLSSLGTCKAMTARMYADRKEWALEKVEVKLRLETQKGENKDTTMIFSEISFEGDLDDEQKQRLYTITDRCPVHKILTQPIEIESKLLKNK